MARQQGDFLIEGTIGNRTFYKMDGKYYIRKKSSLTRDKVLTSDKFANTRKYAKHFGEASRIASQLYKEIDEKNKNIMRFRMLCSEANTLLLSGKSKEEVLEILRKS